MKHGVFSTKQLLFDETAEDHAQFAAEYHEQYSPANAAAEILIETLIANEWRLRRLRRIEDRQWLDASFHFIVLNLDTTITSTSGQAFATESSTFERLQRVVNSCERAYHRALQELAALARAVPLQPQQSTTTSAFPASFRQTPAEPANPLCAASASPRRVEGPPPNVPPPPASSASFRQTPVEPAKPLPIASASACARTNLP